MLSAETIPAAADAAAARAAAGAGSGGDGGTIFWSARCCHGFGERRSGLSWGPGEPAKRWDRPSPGDIGDAPPAG